MSLWRSAILFVFFGVIFGIGVSQIACEIKESEAKTDVSQELLDKIRKDAKEIRTEIEKLPRKTPEQLVAYNKIRTKWSACRITLEAKTNARLGKLTEDSYFVALKDMQDVKAMIKKYPR